MKKIILSIFALGTLAMNAQEGSFAKGNVALNGEVGNLTSKILDAKVSPSLMYFVTDNIALRGGLNFGTQSGTVAGVSTGESSGFGINLGANYYFTKSRFTPFIGAGVEFGSGTTKNASGAENKTSNIGVNVFPGVNAFLSKRFAINASFGSLGYSSNTSTTPANVETKTSNFGLDFNMNTMRLGVTWVLN
jgi:outer membrane protein